MSAWVALVLFVGWAVIGGALLRITRIELGSDKALLAPTVGLAASIVLTSAASFAGFSIRSSVWLVAAVVIASSILLLRDRRSWKLPFAFYGLLFLANLATVGIGLILYGDAWQGVVNTDAAVISLGAQYFMAHGFFFKPALDPIFSGIDYANLSPILYVHGGQRFGDAMLLGLSAASFDLQPDQLYMAHGLALRCAMLAATTLIIPRASAKQTWFVLVLMSLSPLGSFAYLNELTSQIGGMALLFATIVLYDRFLQSPAEASRFACISAVLFAALCEAYPESLPYLVLSAIMLTVHRAISTGSVDAARVTKFAGISVASMLILVNLGLPNVLAATANILSWGGVIEGGQIRDVRAIFRYALSPEMFSYLVGFEAIGQSLQDPQASIVIAAGGLACLAALIFILVRARAYPLLSSLTLTTLAILAFFSFKAESFGAFKMLILAQPLVFAAFAAMMLSAWRARRYWALGLGSLACMGMARSDEIYIRRSLPPAGGLPALAQARLLDKIEILAAKSPDGIVLEAQEGLLAKFAMLRPKRSPVVLGAALKSMVGTNSLIAHTERSPFFRFLPKDDGFDRGFIAQHEKRYAEAVFGCAAELGDIRFEMLHDKPDTVRAKVLLGNRLSPLNKLSSSERDLIYVDSHDTKPWLILRSSAVGGIGPTSESARAYYGTEGDFALPGESLAAVGRYLLMEVVSLEHAPMMLRVSGSASPLGGEFARQRTLRIIGENAVDLPIVGGGAYDLTSPPVRPCIVEGRNYVLFDFGPVQELSRIPPLAYRLADAKYEPDNRQVTGFLRDVSVVGAMRPDASHAVDGAAFDWNFALFDANFEFSGVYEDGWISDRLLLRPKRSCCSKVTIEFDVPGQALLAGPVAVEISRGETNVVHQAIVAGRNTISLDFADNERDYVAISVDKPMELPGGARRRILGVIRHISLQ